MKSTGWKKLIVVVAFALVVLATGFFAVRTVRRAMYWRAHRDEVIRPWMGIPLPISMMLVAAGSFVELGEMKLWQVIVMASGGAVLGDQIGYALGRWGGHRVVARIKRTKNGAAKIAQAEAFAKRWGAAGIFFT